MFMPDTTYEILMERGQCLLSYDDEYKDNDKYKYKIHKYTNKAYGEVPERPNMWHILEKRIFQGYQKLIFPCVKHVNTKVQIHKYTHTHTSYLSVTPVTA